MNPYRTDEPDHLRYHEFNRTRGRMSGQNRIRSRFTALATPWFDFLLLSLDELGTILSERGWRIIDAMEEEGNYAVEIDRRR